MKHPAFSQTDQLPRSSDDSVTGQVSSLWAAELLLGKRAVVRLAWQEECQVHGAWYSGGIQDL